MKLYKATRLDGTDFRTGTVRYEVGATVVHPVAKKVRDDASTYLSVSTVATDCTGFSWPCRLFVVEGIGRGLRAERYSNKRCFSALRVVEERPAHEVLGPQGVEVVAIIERAETLTGDEAEELSAARSAARYAARYAARSAARYAARSAARSAAWDAARSAAWDAVLATLVRELITPEDYDTLIGPWRQVIGDAS